MWVRSWRSFVRTGDPLPRFQRCGRLQSWGKWTAAYSSELLSIECWRAIIRLRLTGLYDDDQAGKATQELVRIERTTRRIRLSRSIIREAARTMPTVVKTLDAIHLVSAVAIRERRGVDLLFCTHDSQQAIAAAR